MLTKKILSSTIVAALAIAAPAFAQSQIDNNQPVQGSLHARAADMQNKLNAAYDAGNLSSTELAEMQRDLDGILVKEDKYNTSATGLTSGGMDNISKSLDLFEGKLARHGNKVGEITKADPTSSRQAAVDVSNKENAPVLIPVGQQLTGNQSSIVQPVPILVPAKNTVVVPASETVIVPAAADAVVVPAAGDTVVVPVSESDTIMVNP